VSKKKLATTIYITPEQDEALKRLNAATKVPPAEIIRQGIDLVLKQRAGESPAAHPFLIGDRR
jgi:hypothetical protein